MRAGISVQSGIPTVIPLIRNLLTQLNCSPEDLKTFLKDNDLPIPFESIIQDMKDNLIFEGNKAFLPEFVRLFNAESNANHYLLAGLFEQNKISNIITTNFDRCIENAFADPMTKRKKLIVNNEREEALQEMPVEGRLIKIHGSTESPSSIGATVDQITKTEFFNKNQIILDKILSSSPAILFLGYSCSDKWDVTRIFTANARAIKPRILFWQHFDGQVDRPTESQKKIFKDYPCIWMTGNTDGLIAELCNANKVTIPEYHAVPKKNPFADLKPLYKNYVLGRLFRTAALFKPAIRYLEAFIDDGKDRAELLPLMIAAGEVLGELYRQFNRFKKSRSSFLQAIALLTMSSDFTARERAFILPRLNRKLAMLLLGNNHEKLGEHHMNLALVILQPYLKMQLTVNHQFELAEVYNDLAFLYYQQNELDTAISNTLPALNLRKQLAEIYPQRYLIYYSESLSNLGTIYHFKGDYDKAVENCSTAITIVRELAEANPVVYLAELSKKLNNLGAIYRDQPDRKMALKNLKEALAIRVQLAKKEAKVYEPHVAYTLINFSVVYLKGRKNRKKSLFYLEQAIPILIKFKRVAAVNKHFRKVDDILLKWSIDPRSYFEQKWAYAYQDD